MLQRGLCDALRNPCEVVRVPLGKVLNADGQHAYRLVQWTIAFDLRQGQSQEWKKKLNDPVVCVCK